MNPKASRRTTLFGLTLILCLVLFQGQGCNGCNQPLQISDGFFSAIVRADGKIQTNFSTDGLNWQPGFIHADLGTVDKGVGITTDKAGVLVFLAFFTKNDAGSNKLFVRTGLGNNWETHTPTQINVNAASAPAICRIDDRFFFMAWNNGNGGISTSLFDKQNLGTNNAFRLSGDINDNLAAGIEGTPSVTALNNQILVVWQTREGYASNITSFNPANPNVSFGTSSALNVAPLRGTPVGPPQVTSDDARFVLSIGCQRSAGEDLVTHSFCYFISIDGRSWAAQACVSAPLVNLQVRPHSIAIDRNSQVAQLVAGSNDGRAEIMRNCGGSKRWRDNSAFNDEGALVLQPAIVFRKGNQ